MNLIKSLVPFKKNALSTAVCLGLVTISPNIQAVTLNANTSADLLDGTPVTDSQTNSLSVTSSSSNSAVTGYSSSVASGNDTGWMYANARGDGAFSSMANIQQVVNFTNTSAFAQSYAFDYTINFGSLTSTAYDPLSAGDFVSASNKVSIKLNGVEIFNSEATLLTTNSGSALTTNGTVLGAYVANSDYYNWSAFSGTLDLGIFNVGESFTLEYDIFTFANSNVANSVAGCSAYGDGYGCASSNYAKSQFGDPNGISGMPINGTTVTGTQASSVPEAGALLLFGTGLAGLAFTRRKKARKH